MSIWRNPDQERNKRNARDNLKSQGVKLTHFSGSHLAPKYFTMVANSKKLVAILTHKQKSTFHASINFHGKHDEKEARKNPPKLQRGQ